MALSVFPDSCCQRNNSYFFAPSEYAGAAACFPADRQTIDKLFDASDLDNSGTIDEEEFTKIMIVCCGQILSRVVLYLAMLLLIVPCLAHLAVLQLKAMVSHKPWFETLTHLVQDPIAKVPWLDALFDWETLVQGKFQYLGTVLLLLCSHL